ncbi:MAG: tRNA dimethylallyltransferase, partial [Myxococcota bacterium]
PVPNVPPEVRERLAKMSADRGPQAMYDWLLSVDPQAAERIEGRPRNTQRVLRALEVFEASGEPITAFQARFQPKLRYPVWLMAPRFEPARLSVRIDARVDVMMQRGFVAEVEALLESGVDPQCRAMGALGYKELAAHIQGQLGLDSAVELIKRGHRRYAKRQRTWFRKTPGVAGLDASVADLGGQAAAVLASSPLSLPS